MVSQLMTMYIVYLGMENTKNQFMQYDKYTDEYSDNTIIELVSGYCGLFNATIDKINCVNKFVSTSGNYDYIITKEIVEPDNLIKDGGDCKSWTVFYRTIFKKMGIESKEVSTNNHVFVMAFDEYYYCIVDMQSIDCNFLGDYNETKGNMDKYYNWIYED
jgi:hypothetical protein